MMEKLLFVHCFLKCDTNLIFVKTTLHYIIKDILRRLFFYILRLIILIMNVLINLFLRDGTYTDDF